jgi:hypothetical protein
MALIRRLEELNGCGGFAWFGLAGFSEWRTLRYFGGMLKRAPLVLRLPGVARRVAPGKWDRLVGYSFRYSRRRRVCVRLTGISVAFASFIRRR